MVSPFASVSLESASFRIDPSWGLSYPPPDEVSGLLFSDAETLAWGAERSVGVYQLYRDRISALTGLDYGECEQQNLQHPTTTDADPVPAGDGFFYLVTAQNRLAEEGTKGFRSDGDERHGTVCP